MKYYTIADMLSQEFIVQFAYLILLFFDLLNCRVQANQEGTRRHVLFNDYLIRLNHKSNYGIFPMQMV